MRRRGGRCPIARRLRLRAAELSWRHRRDISRVDLRRRLSLRNGSPAGCRCRRRDCELRRRLLVVDGTLPCGARLLCGHQLVINGCWPAAARVPGRSNRSRLLLGKLWRNRRALLRARLWSQLRGRIGFRIDWRGRLIGAADNRLPGPIAKHGFDEPVVVSGLTGIDELPAWIERLAGRTGMGSDQDDGGRHGARHAWRSNNSGHHKTLHFHTKPNGAFGGA